MGRVADHPPPSSAKVTKGYSYTSIQPLGQFRPVEGVLDLNLLDKFDKFPRVLPIPDSLVFYVKNV
jgi:hypothetical protein